MYMSYCRFEGTREELRACYSDVDDYINDCAEERASDREIDCFRDMVQEMFDFLRDNCIIDDDAFIDWNTVDDICEKMTKGGEE